MASEERTASAFTFVRRSRSALSVEIGGPIKIRFVWYQSRPGGLCGTVTCSVASRTPLRTRRNSFCCSPTMRRRAWSPPRWARGGTRKPKSLTLPLGAFCAEESSMTALGTEEGGGCPSCCSIQFPFLVYFCTRSSRCLAVQSASLVRERTSGPLSHEKLLLPCQQSIWVIRGSTSLRVKRRAR